MATAGADAELAKTLRREATRIEYRPEMARLEPADAVPVVVDLPYISRAITLRKRRRGSQAPTPQSLLGVLRAVDLSRRTLRVLLDSGRMVRGSLSDLILYPLARLLGRRVRLTGEVEMAGKNPRRTHALEVEPLDDDRL